MGRSADCVPTAVSPQSAEMHPMARMAVSVTTFLFIWFLSITPAHALAVGNAIVVTSSNGVNVRSTPGGTLVGGQGQGSTGTIVGGPQNAPFGGVSYTWWNVNFSSGADGWVIQDGIAAVTVYTLTVSSSNPSSGVYIYVGPNDRQGQADGTTSFTRQYNSGTSVTLIAPTTAGGNTFLKWTRNGSDY